ncbi:inositol-3-phosphate synthase [Nonomuraea antimicrobica]|uniref:Inositol-3-phosphate synthase n=1 Tax=Nonomuraea antimicrobica TaxID=561173 RepID=A0ABP7D1J9_9ACTN
MSIASADVPTGIWFNGARGSVATTAVTGLLALREGLVAPIGCVTKGAEFAHVQLPDWAQFTVGGHDIVNDPIEKRAEHLVGTGVIPPELYQAVRPGYAAVEAELREGCQSDTLKGTQHAAIERMSADIAEFRERNHLHRVVVVNVASTEAPVPLTDDVRDVAKLEQALLDPSRRVLPPSSMAALAAFRAGCAFVDFTPSAGARLPALAQTAERLRVPYAGSDGKTGETLLRTVLAPMFTSRALRVLSWAGTNLLGGGDGATLADSATAESKMRSKSGVLPSLLGEDVPAPLHIDNVPDLGDHKTAWDHISFEGFLGIRMALQFTWQGIDSTLAAPLVLDLARLMAAAHAAGRVGAVTELAFFFKDPVGLDTHELGKQQVRLVEWARSLSTSTR